MQLKKLSLGIVTGFLLIVVMTGCDQGHDHNNGHSHDSSNHETEKTNKQNPTNHNTID